MTSSKSTQRSTGSEKSPGMHDVSPADPKAIIQSIARVLPEAEIYYADTIMGLAIGPFVSKLSIGTLNAADNIATSARTIVMPTNALADLARHVFQSFQTAAETGSFDVGYKTFLETLKNNPTAPNATEGTP